MDDKTITPTAKALRNEYLRSWNAENPEKVKLIRLRYWEKKAKQLHGQNYVGPEPGEAISKQALEIKRKYYRDYQKENADAMRRNNNNYWNRKAKQLEDHHTTKEG